MNLGSFMAADRMVASFGELGSRGWELVAMYDKGSNWLAQMEKGFALFKRVVPDGEQPDGPWAEATHATEFRSVPSTVNGVLLEIERLEKEQSLLERSTNKAATGRLDEITDRLVALNVQLAKLEASS